MVERPCYFQSCGYATLQVLPLPLVCFGRHHDCCLSAMRSKGGGRGHPPCCWENNTFVSVSAMCLHEQDTSFLYQPGGREDTRFHIIHVVWGNENVFLSRSGGCETTICLSHSVQRTNTCFLSPPGCCETTQTLFRLFRLVAERKETHSVVPSHVVEPTHVFSRPGASATRRVCLSFSGLRFYWEISVVGFSQAAGRTPNVLSIAARWSRETNSCLFVQSCVL